jgi:hypothetical protein
MDNRRGKPPSQAPSAKRQARLKARWAELGLTQIAFWIPLTHKADFLDAARRVRNEPDLEVNVRKPKREGARVPSR